MASSLDSASLCSAPVFLTRNLSSGGSGVLPESGFFPHFSFLLDQSKEVKLPISPFLLDPLFFEFQLVFSASMRAFLQKRAMLLSPRFC